MKYNNIFYARHPGNNKQLMFELPGLDLSVNKGDKLVVNCKNGEQTVFATTKNFIIPREVAKATADAMGGYWPLANAKGKVVWVTAEEVMPFKGSEG